MDYVIDLDPAHLILRVTIMGKILTDQLAIEAYRTLARPAAQGGPYAAITDCSQVEEVKVSSETVRFLSQEAPAVPVGRPRIAVQHKPAGYGLARMFELLRDGMAGQHHVVWSLDEAYAMLGVTPEDFTERLFPEVVAA